MTKLKQPMIGTIPAGKTTKVNLVTKVDKSITMVDKIQQAVIKTKLQPPVFNPAGGVFNDPQTVSITADVGVNIYYTIDGNEPDETSTLYTEPISVSAMTTLKAKAYKSLQRPSIITSETYTFPPAGFAYAPAGNFVMGDTKGGGGEDQTPTHNVTLNSFYMGKYLVTQADYTAIMGSNPARNYGVGDNYPVYTVNWYSAIKYCNLRSISEGLTPVYSINNSTNPSDWGAVPNGYSDIWNNVSCNWDANGYRLPTEAEWEYAARGATNDPDYFYSGGDDIDVVGWYLGNNNPNKTKQVGTKAPNALGLYDMSGNLYEWCWDWGNSNYYSNSPSNNPKGPESGSYRVLRGGFWFIHADFCRNAFRIFYDPSWNKNFFGFRVCRNANL